MYTTCMFCKRPLGTNEVVERFPVGRRLAFDAEKGRLWVVCPKCQRWNLTPLEERWEAVEDCKRLFRETPMRVSSENVGLARLQRAVHEIESVGHPGRFVAHVAKLGYRDWKGRSGYMRSVPDTTRLALEMALHEEQERRALEGELWILEQAWREAEEIAAIADSLLLPARTEAFFDRHGQGA